MRLSDICRLDGCEQPHHRRYSHIADGVRYDFCCESHQLSHIAAYRTKQFALRRGPATRPEAEHAHA